MRISMTRVAIAAVTLTMAAIGTAVLASPAQAAPPLTLSEAQVQNQTVNRSTERSVWYDGSLVELRSGYYQGYQYGWARLAPGAANWREGHALVLMINKGDGNGWIWGPSRQNNGDGIAHTGGAITYASPTYQFRACLFNGAGYNCTNPW